MKTTILDFSGRIEMGNCANIALHIADRLGGEAHTIKVSDAGIAPCGGCRYGCLNPDKLRCDNPDGSLEICSDYIVLSTHKHKTKGFHGDLMQNKECVGAVDRYLESCLGDQNSAKAVQQ